jgi:2-polyprenyl-6-methoxyphenol hydroxylase-like FAD-dependent oxidoreductase
VIAGAGPAGAHLALRLARKGWTVALIDRRTFPRPKPCGEFLSPACLPLLDDLGLRHELEELGAQRIPGMRLAARGARAHGEYATVGPFDSPGYGLGIRREVLDERAVAAARAEPNITVLEGWTISDVLRGPDGRATGLVVKDPQARRVDLRARFTVGADGVKSRVAAALGWLLPSPEPQRFAIVARFRGVGGPARAEVFVLGRDYYAACPVDGGEFTAALVLDRQDLPKGHAALEALFFARLCEAATLAERLRGAELVGEMSACGPLGSRVVRCSGPGVALVGDACGFVDPLTGEGLFIAMRGAELLAAVVDQALREPSRERALLRRYERERAREFGARRAFARLLQRGLRRRGVPERVMATLQALPRLCDVVMALTGDYLPPRGLLRPSTWRYLLQRQAPHTASVSPRRTPRAE